MSSDQLLDTVRGKLAQVSQLAAQFVQLEAELRDSFEQLQSLHDREVQSLHDVCRQNGVSIPHKPRSTNSWAGNHANNHINSRTSNRHTFDQSVASGNRGTMGGGPSGQGGGGGGNGGYFPPPPVVTNGISADNNNNTNPNSLSSPRGHYQSHARSKSHQNNRQFGLPTAQNLSMTDDDSKSISTSTKNVPLPPGPPPGPPPSNHSNLSTTTPKKFGFGVSPRSVKKVKKQTLLPSNGLDEKEFYKKYWIESGKIGEGSFARVRRITRKEDKKVFALKMVKKKGKSDNDIAAFQKEILVLQQCSHKNIVKLLDWCDTRKRIYMVVEFCDGGDVFERVLQFKKFNESTAAHVVSQVASGLEHCHSKGFVHRDLKPDNLMYLTKDEKSEIKIIDFGLAQICKDGQMCTTPCGTAHYAAPEVLGNQAYDQTADMWSLGVIIYTLLCGFPPFFDANNNMKNLYAMIKKGKWSFPSPFWDDISSEAKDLISKLLQKNPKQRLSATQVLEHKWVANTDAVKSKDFRSDYINQMQKWQSTRHATEMSLQNDDTQNNNDKSQPVDLYKQNDNGNNGKKYM